MKLARLLAASVAALVCTAAPASAAVTAPHAMVAVDANKILAEVDRRAAVFEDQQYSATMSIFKGGELKKTLVFSMIMKGLEKQFLTFSAPGDIAGMKVLMQDADTLYVYMPEFKKVRRVAAHMQSQGFMGSTFTYEDMTLVRMSSAYNAELAGRDGAETTLKLTAKEDANVTYKHIDMVIDGTKGGVTRLRYYDGAGAMVREQIREGWTKIEGELMPTKVTMSDRNGDSTVVELAEVKVNQGIKDDVFSRRMMLRG